MNRSIISLLKQGVSAGRALTRGGMTQSLYFRVSGVVRGNRVVKTAEVRNVSFTTACYIALLV